MFNVKGVTEKYLPICLRVINPAHLHVSGRNSSQTKKIKEHIIFIFLKDGFGQCRWCLFC